MKQILTVVCKLQLSDDQKHLVDETLQAFAQACQYVHETVDPKIRNKHRIQTLIYHDIRARFGLSANLAIRAIARVAANRKAATSTGSTVKRFAVSSIDYDQRIFSFCERDLTVSLTLLHGRERLTLDVGNYQRVTLAGANPTSAHLCVHQDKQYYIHIQRKTIPPTPCAPRDIIGIDMGRVDIAHTSTDEAWSGRDIQRRRDHFVRLRTALARKVSKGTRSTRRRCRKLLARLSGRESRFQRHINHVISKHLIQQATACQAALALEDLTGIRERTKGERRSKTERRRMNSWAFSQLRQFLVYKAHAAGVVVYLVPAAYTSQMCHQCLHMGSRSGKRFACTNPACIWSGDADLNGALNIRTLGQTVSRPRGPWLYCPVQLQGS